ncbi:hypothetical protein GE061_013600 [Apolygus lucorum]|uniref:Uncharacterized protein n=1 Tax=Apolygus lucorum TaxID=248454 RepID=A0A6A4K7B7_APOLU|nr:hypothetical protein GE061_013600 [Apolygus lucorum]
MEAIIAAVVFFLYVLNAPSLVDARYCKLEVGGQVNYYACPRNEYCCSKGCCISPTFQFYQLWYYWLMVIFMLVVCSGGQWWYRYWVNGGRYLIPPPHVSVSGGTARPLHHRSPVPREAPTRVLYHPSHSQGSTIVFWKPPYPGRPLAEPPPSYAAILPPSPKLLPSGPPPSYESVVGLSSTTPNDPPAYPQTATSDLDVPILQQASASGLSVINQPSPSTPATPTAVSVPPTANTSSAPPTT